MTEVYRILAKKAMAGALMLPVFLLAAQPALARVPNDTRYSDQAAVWNQIGAPQAWDYSIGSSKVIVAVIDTGIDTWHPDLAGNIWTNSRELADNGIDDDHNGFVDDVHGWNFVENNNDPRTSVFNTADDKGSVRHGTVIAGIIGEQGNNERGGTGLNWQVSIMSLRAITSSGTGALSNVTRAVEYAIDNGANVISMSFVGKYDEPTLRAALYRAYQKGVVVVTAAGNHEDRESGDLNKNPQYPACYDRGQSQNWIMTVASVNASDQISFFSNTGDCVDIAAPGENIYSSERYAPQYGYTSEFGGGWEGTSFAAPLVAGAAALLKAAHPDWKPDQIIAKLITSADSIATKNAFISNVSYGRLNIGKALSSSPPIITSVGTFTVDGKIVRRFDTVTQKSSDVAVIDGGKVLLATQLPASQQFAVLVNRQKTWIVQIYDADGRLDHETTLVADQKGVTITRLQIALDGGFVLEKVVSKSKQRTLVFFDTTGKKRSETKLNGSSK